MTLQLSPAEVAFYRSVRKTAVILLLMMKLDSPTPAKRIAEILDLDYATTRRHLKTLSNLGVLTETFSGWSLLQGGIQLLLPERSYPSSFRTHPQAVDNGDRATDSDGKASRRGVKLLANPGTAHKPRCQRPYYLHHPSESYIKRE